MENQSNKGHDRDLLDVIFGNAYKGALNTREASREGQAWSGTLLPSKITRSYLNQRYAFHYVCSCSCLQRTQRYGSASVFNNSSNIDLFRVGDHEIGASLRLLALGRVVRSLRVLCLCPRLVPLRYLPYIWASQYFPRVSRQPHKDSAISINSPLSCMSMSSVTDILSSTMRHSV